MKSTTFSHTDIFRLEEALNKFLKFIRPENIVSVSYTSFVRFDQVFYSVLIIYNTGGITTT